MDEIDGLANSVHNQDVDGQGSDVDSGNTAHAGSSLQGDPTQKSAKTAQAKVDRPPIKYNRISVSNSNIAAIPTCDHPVSKIWLLFPNAKRSPSTPAAEDRVYQHLLTTNCTRQTPTVNDVSNKTSSRERGQDELKLLKSAFELKDAVLKALNEKLDDREAIQIPERKVSRKRPRKVKPASDDEEESDESEDDAEGSIGWGKHNHLDYESPPLSNIDEMFSSIADVALSHNFVPACSPFATKGIRVFTMCSGTESPFISMNLLQKALARKGHKNNFKYQHLGSVEIEPLKQAFIERNFAPPVIFRDVTDFSEYEHDQNDDKRPLTAYGAPANPPEEIHILIAGSSCVDYSGLNNKRQSTKGDGESSRTLDGIAAYARAFQPTLVLLENVAKAPWEEIRDFWKKAGYYLAAVQLDSLNFYLPQTRRRGYCIAINEAQAREVGLDCKQATESWVKLMAAFQRRASSPYTDFTFPEDDPRVQLAKELPESGRTKMVSGQWTKCRQRHLVERSDNKLGSRNPYTNRTSNSKPKVNDEAWQTWLLRQTVRVQDVLDIHFLKDVALRDFDFRFKHRNINVSQNIDRDTDARQWGIVGCITPRGEVWDSRRGGPLSGLEVFHLQGMPIGDLSLGKESSKHLQDLAGNAMSTTVIGAAIASAIIACHKTSATSIFAKYAGHSRDEPKQDNDLQSSEVSEGFQSTRSSHNPPQLIEGCNDISANALSASLETIISLAASSQPLCRCEGLDRHTRHPLKYCPDCFYTCCEACSRDCHSGLKYMWPNPSRTPARDFIAHLTTVLPPFLTLGFQHGNDPAARDNLFTGICLESARTQMSKALEDEVQFREIKFEGTWKVVYESENARLELEFVKKRCECDSCSKVADQKHLHTDVFPVWFLFAKPPSKEPMKSKLRGVIRHPIARMEPSKKLFEGRWKVWKGPREALQVRIRGAGDEIHSWERELGLEAQPFAEMNAFSHLEVELLPQGNGEVPDTLQKIVGTYKSFRQCPAASGTLHKKLKAPTAPEEESPVWLFLNPNPLEDGYLDRMAFATQPPRQNLIDERTVLAKLDAKWRPVTSQGLPNGEVLLCELLDRWSDCSSFQLSVSKKNAGIRKWHWDPRSSSIKATPVCAENNSTVLRIQTEYDSGIRDSLQHTKLIQIDLENKPDALKGLGWMTSRASEIPHLDLGWQNVDDLGMEQCPGCWPMPPKLRWVLKQDSAKQEIRAVENAREASRYEQLIKNRPRPARALAYLEGDKAVLDIQINVQTLAHRASSQLLFPQGSDFRLKTVSWRLSRYQQFELSPPFGPLQVLSNESGNAILSSKVGTRDLWMSQRKLLNWMQRQENLHSTWEELSLVESCLPALGWRLEAQAVVRRDNVRGGVIADEVGAGKTTTSLALVSLDYSQRASGEDKFKTSFPEGYFTSHGTLILVPKNILPQWKEELCEMLRWPELRPQQSASGLSQPYFVIISNIQTLQKFSHEQIRSATIILAPWDLFQDETYWSHLSGAVCAPNVPSDPGRAFQEWLDQALSALQPSVTNMKIGHTHFWEQWTKHRKNLDAYDKFVKPLNRKIAKETSKEQSSGKAHKRAKSGPDSEGSKVTAVKKEDHKIEQILDDFRAKGDVPVLLHMFAFRRLIVDEFTYIEGKTLLGLLKIEATSKWLLSGTPPIHDYDSMNTMAKLLDTRISTFDEESGKYGFGQDKAKMLKDRSRAQEFHSYQNLVSAPYKQAVYEHAKKFALTFIRKNRPSQQIPAKTEAIVEFDLSPGELVTYKDVERLLDQDRTFNRKPPKPEPNEYVFFESQLTSAIEQTTGPLHALICSTTMIHHIVDVPHSDFKEREVEILEHMYHDQRKFVRSKTEDLLTELRQLWGCESMVRDKHPEYATAFAQLQKDVIGGVVTEHDMVAILDQLIWFAKKNPLAPTAKPKPEPKPDPKATNGSEDADPEVDGQPPNKKAKVDRQIEEVLATVDKNEMVKRVAQVAFITESLAQGLRRLRFLRFVQATGSLESLARCPCCGFMVDDLLEVKVSPQCGHLSACERCLVREAWFCCPAYEPSKSLLAHQLTMKAPGSLGEVRGSRMREAVALIKSFPGDDFTLVFVQFPELTNAFVKECNSEGIAIIDGTHRTRLAVDRFRKAATGHPTKGNGKGDTPRVLVLQVDSPDAAGWNLHCANRIVFLAPLVAESPEERLATMTQAIGRSWRPRQTKVVHVYHLVARGTIELDMVAPS